MSPSSGSTSGQQSGSPARAPTRHTARSRYAAEFHHAAPPLAAFPALGSKNVAFCSVQRLQAELVSLHRLRLERDSAHSHQVNALLADKAQAEEKYRHLLATTQALRKRLEQDTHERKFEAYKTEKEHFEGLADALVGELARDARAREAELDAMRAQLAERIARVGWTEEHYKKLRSMWRSWPELKRECDEAKSKVVALTERNKRLEVRLDAVRRDGEAAGAASSADQLAQCQRDLAAAQQDAAAAAAAAASSCSKSHLLSSTTSATCHRGAAHGCAWCMHPGAVPQQNAGHGMHLVRSHIGQVTGLYVCDWSHEKTRH